MKSTLDSLPKGTKASLARIYGNVALRDAMKSLLEVERMEISKDLLYIEADKTKEIAFLQGQAFKCKQLLALLKQVHKEVKDEEERKG